MGSVLITMPKVDDAQRIADAIKNQGMLLDVSICNTGADILRVSNERDFGVVICTKQLRDMYYNELGEMLPKFFGMILITSDSSVYVEDDKIVKLISPFKMHALLSTIDMIIQTFYRAIKKKKKAPIKRSEEEQKLIDNAKAILIERNGMTEPEAFRYIQKTSMDTGRSLVESAQMVLTLLRE